APDEHVLAGAQLRAVDEHAVGGEVDEAVARRDLPAQVLRLAQELLRLHERKLREAAVRRLVAPDLLLLAGHGIEAVARGALATRHVAVQDDLVAGLPARNAGADLPNDARGVAAGDVEGVLVDVEDA